MTLALTLALTLADGRIPDRFCSLIIYVEAIERSTRVIKDIAHHHPQTHT